jgi:glycosyltransferase involved in cell wall biosynthesis
LNPEAFNTSGSTLMGRHSAGEGFLKGFIRHADIDVLHLWNVGNGAPQELERRVAALEPLRTPVNWIGRSERRRLSEAGAVMLAGPRVAREAWARRMVGEHAYSVVGLTHTTAGQTVTDYLTELAYGPVQPWDALICTSRAVRESVELQVQLVQEHFRERLGATRFPQPRFETIPLGVDTQAFRTTADDRRRWREELDIPADAIVALFVGRFSLRTKMNPAPMALALERAAQATGQPLYWVAAGWSPNPALDDAYHGQVREACPSVQYRVVDGRRPDVRFSIWSVADLFLSLSDNIQETFGLTPVEAMAAGLPSVISDWNGYRDTVRHQVDGFRISTYAPRTGLGEDLAFRHAQGWITYDDYVGAAAQFTSVDLDEAAQALADLIRSPALRNRMGQAAAERARQVFDWSVVIPQYQALWAELAALRPKAPAQRRRSVPDNAWRLDPYTLFGSYPTEMFSPRARVALAPGADVQALRDWHARGVAAPARAYLPSLQELERLMDLVGTQGHGETGAVLADFPPSRRLLLERALLWMAKYGLLVITPTSPLIRD